MDPYHFDLDPDPRIRIVEKRPENSYFFPSINNMILKTMIFIIYLLAYYSYTYINKKKVIYL